jgi:hypothetical protein
MTSKGLLDPPVLLRSESPSPSSNRQFRLLPIFTPRDSWSPARGDTLIATELAKFPRVRFCLAVLFLEIALGQAAFGCDLDHGAVFIEVDAHL